MALRDHSLDDKIIHAAKEEFMLHGFRKAALHNIVEKAGITTGALYTRYKNKDALFCSLVQEVMEAAAGYAAPLSRLYKEAQESRDPKCLMAAIRQEEEIYQKLLEDHYEACVLMYCRSAGSSVEGMLHTMMDQKARETTAYFKSIAKADVDLDGVGILMSAQFTFFQQVLEKGYSKEKTLQCLKVVDLYQEAGWSALFEAIL